MFTAKFDTLRGVFAFKILIKGKCVSYSSQTINLKNTDNENKNKSTSNKTEKNTTKINDKNSILSYTQKNIYYRKLGASSLQTRRVGEGGVILDAI